MSELKRIIRPELEKIVEEGIRKAQEREAFESVVTKQMVQGERDKARGVRTTKTKAVTSC